MSDWLSSSRLSPSRVIDSTDSSWLRVACCLELGIAIASAWRTRLGAVCAVMRRTLHSVVQCHCAHARTIEPLSIVYYLQLTGIMCGLSLGMKGFVMDFVTSFSPSLQAPVFPKRGQENSKNRMCRIRAIASRASNDDYEPTPRSPRPPRDDVPASTVRRQQHFAAAESNSESGTGRTVGARCTCTNGARDRPLPPRLERAAREAHERGGDARRDCLPPGVQEV